MAAATRTGSRCRGIGVAARGTKDGGVDVAGTKEGGVGFLGFGCHGVRHGQAGRRGGIRFPELTTKAHK